MPPSIRGAVSQKAAHDISQADLEQAISGRRASWLGGITAGLVVALAVLFVITGPQQFRSLMGHAFLPFSSNAALSTRTTLELIQPEGGNVTVPAYHAVNFLVHVEGKIPAADSAGAIRLLYRYDRNGRYEELPFEPGDTNREWVAMIAGSDLHNGFWYKVAGGDYESPEYQIRVRVAPLPAGFQVHYHFPTYLRLADMDSTNPDLRGHRGADVTLTAHATCTLRSGSLEVLGQKQAMAGQLMDNNRAVRFSLRLEQSGRYRIHFLSQDGDSNPDTRPYTITVLSDLPPLVRITQPTKSEVHLPLNGVLRVEGLATDDFGLTGLRLQMRVNGEPTRSVPYRPGKSWKRPDGSYPLTLDYADVVDLAKLKLKDRQPLQKGMVIEYWLEATDNCAYPPPGPNVGRSQPTYRVVLDPPQAPEAAKQQKKQAEQQKQQKQQAQDQKLAKQTDQQRSDKNDNKPDNSEANGQKQDAGQNQEKQQQDKKDQNNTGKSGSESSQQGTDQGNQQKGDTRQQDGSGQAGKNGEQQQSGSKSDQGSSNKNDQQQGKAQQQSASGAGGQDAKNDLQNRLKKAQDWLNKHQQDKSSGKQNKGQQGKGDNSQPNNGKNSKNNSEQNSDAKNSASGNSDSHPGNNQEAGNTTKSTGQQNGSKTGHENHSNKQGNAQEDGAQQPGTQAKGNENNHQATGKEPGKEQHGSTANSDKQPMKNGNHGTDAAHENQGTPPKNQGTERSQSNTGENANQSSTGQEQNDRGNQSPSQAEATKPNSGGEKSSAGSTKEPGKKQNNAASPGDKGTQANDGNTGAASKNDHNQANPGKGSTAQPSAEDGHKGEQSVTGSSQDKPKGHQTGDAGTAGQNQPGKTQPKGTQPQAGNPNNQHPDKGTQAEQQPGHNAPDKGPTSQSANHQKGQSTAKHSAASGGQPDAKAAEQKKLEHELSDAMKQLQQKDDRELNDLMKKLQSSDSSTRKQASKQLQDKIQQAANNPEVRKQAEDLVKRLQRLNQEHQRGAPGTANANGTKGERGPTGHEGSRHQAGNSSSQTGNDSTAGQQQADAQAKNGQQPSAGKSGQGSSPANASEQSGSQPSSKTGQPSKGTGNQPGSSGKGSAGHEDNRSPQQAGDHTGPGPGDGTRANGNRTGSGVGHFAPGEADPANRDFQKQAGDLQLQEFPKNPPKELLRDLHLTAKDWEALRKAQADMIRQRRQNTSRDTLPARGNGGRGLKDLRAHQIKGGTQEKDLGFTGATHPPAGFGDSYREFTQKGSKAADGK